MRRTTLLDEWHISLRIPRELPAAQTAAILRVLHRQRFRDELARSLGRLFKSHPELRPVRWSLSR